MRTGVDHWARAGAGAARKNVAANAEIVIKCLFIINLQLTCLVFGHNSYGLHYTQSLLSGLPEQANRPSRAIRAIFLMT